MEFICFIEKINVSRAEVALKEDFELASRQSITVRDAASLEIEDTGSFFYITGSDEGVTKCKELIKEFIAESSNLELAKQKINDEGDNAAQGMGAIFG
jgi:hypothetical protein